MKERGEKEIRYSPAKPVVVGEDRKRDGEFPRILKLICQAHEDWAHMLMEISRDGKSAKYTCRHTDHSGGGRGYTDSMPGERTDS